MKTYLVVIFDAQDDQHAMNVARRIIRSASIKEVAAYEGVETGEAVTAEILGETYPNVNLPFRRKIGEIK